MVVLVPTKLDVEEKARHDAEVGLRLGNQALKRSLIIDLEREQAYLDLTNHMKNQNYLLFWNRDYHLNDKGHWLFAQALFRYFSVESTAPSAHPVTR